ncbi:hypothetical protein FIBSPDRAFT_928050 [Athelia psychrophila]|uniref:Uncharacterized protein n=1 Tax=Athelia psychrophila TaxID=1759441 RepID=A0A166QTQ5_9AGAM|nr:hypothetical protein FIBSPDRAFT_928050 [Fibularhizoctonia sp. CBS 109695]
MISATSFDIQVLGKLDEKGPSAEGKYFIVLKVGEDKEIESGDAMLREPGPGWKVEQPFQFDVGSAINIEIFRRGGLGRLSLKHSVAKYTGQGIDLLANDHELVIESADKKAPSISIKLDLVVEDHAKFMEAVDKDTQRLHNVKGADGAQKATDILGPLGIVLQKIVPIIDQFAGSHPVLNAAWIVLSSAYKVVQSQVALDDAVRKLVEILGEMAGQATVCPNLGKIVGSVDINKEIGRTSLHVAWLIHRYADPSIRGKPSMLGQ